MDGLTLLRRAREAGLKIQPAGDMLKITGPKRAEPSVVARAVLFRPSLAR